MGLCVHGFVLYIDRRQAMGVIALPIREPTPRKVQVEYEV